MPGSLMMDSNGDQAAKLLATQTLQDFVNALCAPRIVVLMIPAGKPVDAALTSLSEILTSEDLVIDAGNSNFHDTIRRCTAAKSSGPRFMGTGVSGGKTGARFGPAIMVGGEREDWLRVQPIFEAIAAKHLDAPCVSYLGQSGAGHMVKSVHNGIEYADMQMIAEIYGIMRDGLGMTASRISDVFSDLNDGRLESYLIEISAQISNAHDQDSGSPVLDVIQDTAEQKGTGRWVSIEALNVGVPATTINAAVCARALSSQKSERTMIEDIYGAAPQRISESQVDFEMMRQALTAGKVLCYAQGFELIARISQDYDMAVPLPDVARVWRKGCIIRSKLLDEIEAALETHPEQNILLAPLFVDLLAQCHQSLRTLVALAIQNGMAVPALSAAVSYFDAMRTGRSTANMIQAQRDYFGAHGFERVDRDGKDFHGPWVTPDSL